jgi:hypothetical protein
VIRRVGKKWQLWNRTGQKLLGTYDTHEEVRKAELRARYFRNKKESKK